MNGSRTVLLLLHVFMLMAVWLCTLPANAQTAPFVPAADDPLALLNISRQIEQAYQQDLAALPREDKKEMADLLRLRHANIRSKLDKHELYTSPQASAYLNKLLQEIVSGNALLQAASVHCYFSRSGVPNASYLGEGIIVFNMGLFKRLRNESQAAFVLCHELAHCMLHHSENSIRKYVSTLNSDEVQQELRAIKKNEYNKRTGLEKLLRNITFDSRRHTRDHESQADSMAVELISNTRFATGEALSTLALLDSIDTDSLDTEAALKRFFDAPGYRFQKRWLSKQTSLLGVAAPAEEDAVLADSLKTHPDCPSRIKWVQPLVNKYKSPRQRLFLIDSSLFEQTKSLFEYEIIEYAYAAGNYTKSLFYTLILLQTKPTDPYLVTQTGKLFNSFFDAQKKHQLGKLIDLPSPALPANYNTLLQLIQNLYLEDYAAIGYHYLHPYQSALKWYEPFLAVYITSVEYNK